MHIYIDTFVHARHKCISVYGQPWEIFNEELYQADLLCIITLCLYHNLSLSSAHFSSHNLKKIIKAVSWALPQNEMLLRGNGLNCGIA